MSEIKKINIGGTEYDLPEGGGASAHVEGDALVINNSGGTGSGTGSSGGTSIVDVFELPENPDPNTMYRVTYHKIYQMYFNEDGMELLQDIEPLTILGGGKLNIYTLEELPNNPLSMVEGTNFNFYVIQENLYTYYNNTWVNNNDVCAIIGSLVGSTLTYGGLSNYYKTDFENNTIYIYKYTDLYLGSNRIDSEQLIYSGLHQTINDNNSLYKVIKIPPYVLSPIQNLTIRLTGGNAQEKWVFKPNVEWGGFIFLPTLTDINPLTMTSLQDPHWISGSIATIVDLDNDKKTWIILIGDHSPDADVYYKVEIYGK